MITIRQFTYPTFIGLCGLLAAMADILQQPAVANGVTYGLGCIGLIFLLVPQRVLFNRRLVGFIGDDVTRGVSPKPFGLSCLLLAALVFGFSTLSAKSADNGGVIASQYPQIRAIQTSLGMVEKKLDAAIALSESIQSDTKTLVESSNRWLSLHISAESFSLEHLATKEWHNFTNGLIVAVSNETNHIFEDVQISVLAEDQKLLLEESLPILVQDGYHQVLSLFFSRDDFIKDVSLKENVEDVVSVCVSAKRRDSEEWIVDRRIFRLQHQKITDHPRYIAQDATGAIVHTQSTSCRS